VVAANYINGIGSKFGSVQLAAEGRHVIFEALDGYISGDSNGRTDIFLLEVETGNVVRVSQLSDGTQPNGDSYLPRISPNGEWAFFGTNANNLGEGPGTYVVHMPTGVVRKIPVAVVSAGNQHFLGTTGPYYDSPLLSYETSSLAPIATLCGGGSSSCYPRGISSNSRFITFGAEGPQGYSILDSMTGSVVRYVGGNYIAEPLAISDDGKTVVLNSLQNDVDRAWRNVSVFKEGEAERILGLGTSATPGALGFEYTRYLAISGDDVYFSGALDLPGANGALRRVSLLSIFSARFE